MECMCTIKSSLFNKCKQLLPLASWALKLHFHTMTSFIYPGHSSQTISLMTVAALFYLSQIQNPRIFREQCTTILPQQTYRQKNFEHGIYFHASQSFSFQSWKEKYLLHWYCFVFYIGPSDRHIKASETFIFWR